MGASHGRLPATTTNEDDFGIFSVCSFITEDCDQVKGRENCVLLNQHDDADSCFHQGVGLAFLDLNATAKCSCKDGLHGKGAVDPVVANKDVHV